MATATLRKRAKTIGPGCNGMLMTPHEFDRADFDNDWRYELINGVLVVSPIPANAEVDPNEELGYLLRSYQYEHAKGSALDWTLPKRYVYVGSNRRRADRVIWAGLGRRPRKRELPTIVVEFVSVRRRDWIRDYETKRDEYLEAGIKEYWVIDRFERALTVFTLHRGKLRKRTTRENQHYRTELLPGFELPLARLLILADRAAETDEDE